MLPRYWQQNPKALIPALTAEQKAYQTLLRLQAHEFEVSRQQQKSQSQQQQQQKSQRAQSQLNQLDLRKQEDRYEKEKQAQKLQEPKQREQLQVLSRLKDLAQRQQDLNEKLKELDGEEPRGLRDTRPREQVSEAIKEQEEDLQTLLEGMRDTIERAESAEPLLSRQLYDTLRNTQHDRLEEALEGTRQLLDAGFTQEAEEPEEVARKGIDRLNQGVQQAAESVLGDPVEALRR